jgi:hypothetical protein
VRNQQQLLLCRDLETALDVKLLFSQNQLVATLAPVVLLKLQKG